MGKDLDGSSHDLRYYPSISLESQRKTIEASVKIASVLAEIRTEHLPNTSLEQYCYAILLGQKRKTWHMTEEKNFCHAFMVRDT
jgi:hypothetical protein